MTQIESSSSADIAAMKSAFYLTDEKMQKNRKILFDHYKTADPAKLLAELKENRFFLNPDELEIVLYRDKYVSLPIPPNLIPLEIFPKLKIPLIFTDINEAGSIAFVSPKAKIGQFITLIFRHQNNILPPLKKRLKFGNLEPCQNIKEFILKSVGNGTWNDCIASFAKKLKISSDNIILRYIYNYEDHILLPMVPIKDSLEILFKDPKVLNFEGDLFYDTVRVGRPDLHFELISQLKNVPPSKCLDKIYKILRLYFYSNPPDETQLPTVIQTIDNNLYSYFGSYFSKIIIIDDLTRSWSELSIEVQKHISKIRNKEDIDIEFLFASSIISCDKLPSLIVSDEIKMLRFLTTPSKSAFGQSAFLPYPIICSAIISSPSFNSCKTIVLSLGFIHVLDFLPPEGQHVSAEIIPETYKFSAKSSTILIWGHPISDIVCVPYDLEGKSLMIVTSKGNISTTFQNKDEMVTFLRMLSASRAEISMPFIQPPLPAVTYKFAFSMTNVHFNVEVAGEKWELSIPTAKYLKKIGKFTSIKKSMIQLNELMDVPKPLKEVDESQLVFTSREIADMIGLEDPPDPKVLFATSVTFDLSFTNNQSDNFLLMKMIGVADFSRSVLTRSGKLLDLQLSLFKSAVNAYRIQKTPLLHFSALFSDDLSILTKIAKSADTNLLDNDRRSALFYVTSLVSAQILLEKKCNVDIGDSEGQTPLTKAIESKNTDLVCFLTNNGAAVNKSSHKNCHSSILHSLQSHNSDNLATFEFLMNSAPDYELNSPTENGDFLTHVCLEMKLEKPLLLLSQKANFDPNRHLPSRPHPIHYFIETTDFQAKDLSLFAALLSLPNLKLNIKDDNGKTPLCRFVTRNAAEFVEKLVEDPRCDVNLQGDDGRSPLYSAIYSNNAKIVEILLNAGALVNAPNNDTEHFTPLRAAVMQSNLELVKLLLQWKADPALWYGNDGKLPTHIEATQTILNLLEFQLKDKKRNIQMG